jgi:peptidoglycan/xylan/chitin deacetylase (PgdA/CDA1 family)
MLLNKIFYTIKPLIPRHLQILVRRQIATYKRKRCSNIWPIDPSSAQAPNGWKGWSDQKQFALILTHDVDTAKGHDRCYELMDLEEKLGFRSSFNFVPERYKVSFQLIKDLKKRGFEVGVHGLKHDGKLYLNRRTFEQRAKTINAYINDWECTGFRSPSMHCNLYWLQDLDIEYDLSTFDTDPFEPQPIGVSTIFPFCVNDESSGKRYIELPYTMPQDFTLFILLKERNTNIWKKKIDWIAEKGGMALINTHPDYMNFDNKNRFDEYPVEYYVDLLKYVKCNYVNDYLHLLPKDICSHVRTSGMGYLECSNNQILIKAKNGAA